MGAYNLANFTAGLKNSLCHPSIQLIYFGLGQFSRYLIKITASGITIAQRKQRGKMKYIGLGIAATLLVAALIYVRGYLNPAPAAPQANLPSQELQAAPVQEGAPRKLDLEELMPAEDLALIEAMEPVDHANMSEAELAKDQQPPSNSLKPTNLSSFEQPQKNANGQPRTWQDALVSTRTRPELNQQLIKIAGYIVPLEYNAEQQLTAFFLVPYFGACIHVPPPPPNQIIYVRTPKGVPPQELYTPFWVEGRLSIETKEHDLGVASYSLDANRVELYQDE